MKLYWAHPMRDETLVFDLPDGAAAMQIGALCSCGDDRRIVHVDHAAETWRCSWRAFTNEDLRAHANWPRLRYSILMLGVGEHERIYARVTEGDATFVVNPTKVRE